MGTKAMGRPERSKQHPADGSDIVEGNPRAAGSSVSAVPGIFPVPAPDVAIVFPVRDEEGNLGPLLEEIETVMEELPLSYEVIAVDDGSIDRSLEVLRQLAAREPRLRVLAAATGTGQSGALAAGLRAATASVVVTMDSDLQNDPADIPRLLAALEDADVVSGVRRVRRDTWLRRISSRVANGVRRVVLADGVHDVGCSLKAYRREFLQGVPVFDGMHRFLPALVGLRGARVTEIEVGHRPRRHGSSSYGVGNRLWRGIVDLFGVWWLRRRWIDPGRYREP